MSLIQTKHLNQLQSVDKSLNRQRILENYLAEVIYFIIICKKAKVELVCSKKEISHDMKSLDFLKTYYVIGSACNY